MFDYINSEMEKGLEVLCAKLDAMVMMETVKLVRKWNEEVPGYEFQIGCHDLCSFRYKEKGSEEWVDLDIYSYDNDGLEEIRNEAEEFSTFYCNLDTRFVVSSFNWVDKKGEI